MAHHGTGTVRHGTSWHDEVNGHGTARNEARLARKKMARHGTARQALSISIARCVCVFRRRILTGYLWRKHGVISIASGISKSCILVTNQLLGIMVAYGFGYHMLQTYCVVLSNLYTEMFLKGFVLNLAGGLLIHSFFNVRFLSHVASHPKSIAIVLSLCHCFFFPVLFQWDQKKLSTRFDGKNNFKKLTPSPIEEPPSEEEIARKAALKEKQGQRLREMAEAKRTSRINELENECKGLEFLLQQLEHVKDSDIPSFLSETGYVSKQEIEAALVKVTQSLRKAKGEQADTEEKTDPTSTEKYSMVDTPDNMLTPEQLKEKRKQVFIKTTSEARQRAKQKRLEEELERERQNKQDEEKRLENPELYREQLRTKHRELSEKVEQRKRLKTNGGHTNGNNNGTGGVGRGERLNAAQKERMRLLTTAAFDRGKGEDTFGIKDEDWQLYKLMSKDNDDDDEGPDEDEAELARMSARLKEIDPTFLPKLESVSSSAEVPRLRPLTKEDFQIILGVERFRCPEILFNPNLVGIDQAGLDEMAGVSMRRLPTRGQSVDERITNSILMTGGSCLFPGMAERLEAGIRMIRPCGTPIRVVKASDPILDAWRGAAAYAAAMQFPQQTFTRMDYYEKGEDWLRGYQMRYTI
ncbi:hypothetical protein RHSIM_Rhsim04G0164300 [Rhododendron simsii]|uniref:Actin-related protein 5 n=1 Tax=Rhododendron simsii TaxID=118357 RepID=A0A834H253_RHOSS|nr:hypothetical protein RHSIM_Rhsim04G0164300 [Rhododendron simsii]